MGDPLELESAVLAGEPAGAVQSAITALVELAEREPLAFDFLMHQSMLAGPAAQAERDELIGRFQRAIEGAWERAPGEVALLDMSARLLLEGTIRLLGLRMRRDGDPPRLLLGEMLAWVDAYTVSGGAARWRTPRLESALLHKQARHGGTVSLHPSLPKGRHRLGPQLARSVQRERITYATAEAIRSNGYAELTVADIVAAAGLSRDAFYAQFHDKDEAFDSTAQLVFEHLLARMAGAFFGDAGDWAEQLWEAGWALEQFLECEPSLAHFLFIATYAPPSRIGRVLDFVLAFSLFVEGGNRHRPQSRQVSKTVTEAIVCTVLEAVNFHVRHDRVQELRGLFPAIIYMVFAPFMGTDHARAFVEGKVNAERAGASPSA
jgi:AcrR family transcriptional regulator